MPQPYEHTVIEDRSNRWRGGPLATQPNKIPWLFSPWVPDRVTVQTFAPDGVRFAAPEHSGLNDLRPPGRIPRFFDPGIRYNAGLRQWASQQHFHQAYLPPFIVTTVRAQSTRLSPRSIGGVLGAGTSSAATRHLPSAFVPRTIT